MKSEIKYLGRVVSADGINPDPKAVAKLKNWNIPRTKTELHSFLGFANYFFKVFYPMACKASCPFTCDDGRRLSIFMGGGAAASL